MTRVSFQGIAGAYSEEAIRQYYGPEGVVVTRISIRPSRRSSGSGDVMLWAVTRVRIGMQVA